MTNFIITRQVDELGRIAIPIEFRRELGVNTSENMKVFLSNPDEFGVITVDFNSQEPNAVIQADIGFLIIQKEYNLKLCTLDMWVEDNKLRLKKVTPQCFLSGDTTDLIKYKDTDIYLSRRTIWDLYEMLFKTI